MNKIRYIYQSIKNCNAQEPRFKIKIYALSTTNIHRVFAAGKLAEIDRGFCLRVVAVFAAIDFNAIAARGQCEGVVASIKAKANQPHSGCRNTHGVILTAVILIGRAVECHCKIDIV